MADLRQHLVASRIAGVVATSREDNLRNIGRLLDDAPEHWFGVHRLRDWTFDEVLDVMARRCGIHADPSNDPALFVAEEEGRAIVTVRSTTTCSPSSTTRSRRTC